MLIWLSFAATGLAALLDGVSRVAKALTVAEALLLWCIVTRERMRSITLAVIVVIIRISTGETIVRNSHGRSVSVKEASLRCSSPSVVRRS